jgi:hypothetical protein
LAKFKINQESQGHDGRERVVENNWVTIGGKVEKWAILILFNILEIGVRFPPVDF